MVRPIFRTVTFNISATGQYRPARKIGLGDKFMHNFVKTGLIIKNYMPTNSIRVILQDSLRAIIISQKDNHEFTGTYGLYFFDL